LVSVSVRDTLPQLAEGAMLKLLAGLNGLYEKAEVVMVEHMIVAVKALREMARRRLDSPLQRQKSKSNIKLARAE
jgi:hypothetical protein